MIGAIIGDVVGSRFEFNNYRKTNFKLFAKESRFTDDTVCTMAVADWIVNVGEWNSSAAPRFALRMADWCRRYPMGDYGNMFRNWISNPVPYDSFGNGAAMRIAPVGFNFMTEHGMEAGVRLVTAVSHNHPEGLKGAHAVASAIAMARLGESKEAIREVMESSFGYDLDFTCDQIRPVNWFDETCQVTVPQALVCFLESDDFESAIRLAVSIGGDSDTIACITGGIAEAFYGGVPSWMIEEVMGRLPFEMRVLIGQFYKKINRKL